VSDEEPREQGLAHLFGQFVHGVGGDDGSARARESRQADVAGMGAAVESQNLVRPPRLGRGPRALVDTLELGRATCGDGPGGAGRTRAAAEVHESGGRRRGGAEGLDHGADGEEVERPVVEREGGALAATVERRARAQASAPLDVKGGERLEPAPHLREAEVGQVARAQLFKPQLQGRRKLALLWRRFR